MDEAGDAINVTGFHNHRLMERMVMSTHSSTSTATIKKKLRRAYHFLMQPTAEQEQIMFRQAGARRFIWNWALARRKVYYKEHGRSIPVSQLSAELTALKKQPDKAWLNEVDAQLLQQVLRDLDKAFTGFFRRCKEHAKRKGFPRFKARHRSLPSFRIPQYVSVTDGRVYVSKVGLVRIRQSRQIDGTIKSATFKQNTIGNWYVTIVAEFEMPDVAIPKPDSTRVVGVDVGLIDFATLSNGEEPVLAPKFYRKAQKKLRRAQLVFSRRQSGSNRKAKARLRVARIHEKNVNQRKDFLHKLSTGLIRRFDGVCIEDLALSALVKTKRRGMAKSFNDASFGEFFRQLLYKAEWNRKHVVTVDRFFTSSKKCSACGAINNALTLSDREWTCPSCGAHHKRDFNAAVNLRDEGLRIIAAGHAEMLNARGADVRPANARAVGNETRIFAN